MQIPDKIDFELFKSNVCHKLKRLGDLPFLLDLLKSNEIREYFDKGYYKESFYLLGMLDYISRINNIPICNNFNDLRRYTLEKTVYPSGVLALCLAFGEEEKAKAKAEAIPEFLRFNIVENDVKNVA